MEHADSAKQVSERVINLFIGFSPFRRKGEEKKGLAKSRHCGFNLPQLPSAWPLKSSRLVVSGWRYNVSPFQFCAGILSRASSEKYVSGLRVLLISCHAQSLPNSFRRPVINRSEREATKNESATGKVVKRQKLLASRAENDRESPARRHLSCLGFASLPTRLWPNLQTSALRQAA